jgi:hypothetical protein
MPSRPASSPTNLASEDILFTPSIGFGKGTVEHEECHTPAMIKPFEIRAFELHEVGMPWSTSDIRGGNFSGWPFLEGFNLETISSLILRAE